VGGQHTMCDSLAWKSINLDTFHEKCVILCWRRLYNSAMDVDSFLQRKFYATCHSLTCHAIYMYLLGMLQVRQNTFE
jgi:hypothetical protein